MAAFEPVDAPRPVRPQDLIKFSFSTVRHYLLPELLTISFIEAKTASGRPHRRRPAEGPAYQKVAYNEV